LAVVYSFVHSAFCNGNGTNKVLEIKIECMRILIQQAKINDGQSPYNGQVKDLLIENGIITQIEDKIKTDVDQKISAQNLQVSVGWVDLKANFCEPGYEHKETIETGALAAERGGFTHVCVSPATLPAIDNKAQIEFIKNKNNFSTTRLFPIGCISAGRQGEELAELYDMHQSGAVLFSDDNRHLSSGLLYRALYYVQNFNGKVCVFSTDSSFSKKAQVNEGLASAHTGLKGNPHVAEIMAIERNLRLLEYTNGQLHINNLSTAEGVELIREAKQKGLTVTADVSVNHLIFNETVVLDFDSNFKVNPPYRN
jgi:dihydroorotase